jgi:hypothetical protein
MKDFHEKEKEELVVEQQKITDIMKTDKEKVRVTLQSKFA